MVLRGLTFVLASILLIGSTSRSSVMAAERFEGTFFSGKGDVDYIELLDVSRRMFEPDAEFQNVPMLYTPAWNGLVEGPTWGAWWIQNSYGPTYCALPFYQEPLLTFLQNSQDLWFDQMGDGKRVGAKDWKAPDGSLCDAASPGWIVYKQGDGRTDIHDWGMEFTAAGFLMQAELLLISRDAPAIARYLPKLERCANFVETRRNPKTNLFLAGPAGNLLAPSYAGWKRPDGSYDKAYLAGLSITYIAGLDRLIELEKLAGRSAEAARYAELRERARQGLPRLVTDEGYFIKSLDPDGTRHGVFGAAKHGYFEAVCNHDAVCFRVVDDAQAKRIYAKMAAIPGLRPHDLIITNYPSLDDMYHERLEGIWKFGHWVNGGHWTTCEARMMMGYSRLGMFEDARRSMKRILGFARRFRMDNPLVDFGAAVYQPHQPINCCYDTFGAPAALIRGLFEYLYRSDELEIVPHVPPGIVELQQRFGVRFGQKRLYLSTMGSGDVTAVSVNGRAWKSFDVKSIRLGYDETPDVAHVQIALGGAWIAEMPPNKPAERPTALPTVNDAFWRCDWLARSLGPKPLPLRIGADSDGKSRFLGEIARVRVFGRALRAEEVAAMARNDETKLKNDPALVGSWDFERVGPAGLSAKFVGEVEVVGASLPGGRQSKAIRLTGGGYIEVAHDPKLVLTDAYTLAAWVRPKKLPVGGGRIIDKSTVGTSDNFLLDTHPGNSLRLITRQGVLSYDAKLAPDQWSHVVATFDARGELRLYLNGRQVAGRSAEPDKDADDPARLRTAYERVRKLHERLTEAGLADGYEAAHARLALDAVTTLQTRRRLLDSGKLQPLKPEASQLAADRSYIQTAVKLCDGLTKVLTSYSQASDPRKKTIHRLWRECAR